jgi:hypothetical protein
MTGKRYFSQKLATIDVDFYEAFSVILAGIFIALSHRAKDEGVCVLLGGVAGYAEISSSAVSSTIELDY